MWGKKTVAVIIPALQENIQIFDVIQDFDSTGYVDEILIVGNGEGKNAQNEIKQTRAKYVSQRSPGFGIAIREGINKTKADLLIITEPNGSFKGKDILKLLSYSDDFDMVFGSRTHLPLIQKGSGMTFIRRIVDDLFGKLISFLFLGPPLTDVGCTFRLTSRNGWKKISRDCHRNDEMFITEWLVAAVKNKVKFIEIPVHFNMPRRTFHPSGFLYNAKRGIQIFFYIWRIWLLAKLG